MAYGTISSVLICEVVATRSSVGVVGIAGSGEFAVVDLGEGVSLAPAHEKYNIK